MNKGFWMMTVATALVLSGQSPSWCADAAVGIENQREQKFHAGDTVTFSVNLNEPLPKGEFLQVRVSPTSAGQAQLFNSEESSVDTTRTKFRITGQLPEEIIPGKWHVEGVFMCGPANLTDSRLKSNDISFEVEGKLLVLPTSAEVKIDK